MHHPAVSHLQNLFAQGNTKLHKSTLKKLDKFAFDKQADERLVQAYGDLDQIHQEMDPTPTNSLENPGLVTSQKQASKPADKNKINPANSPENPGLVTSQKQASKPADGNTVRPGKNGNVPPVTNQFKPGQSGNPNGRPAGVSRLVRQLLSHNEQELAKKVAKAWVDQACRGKQTALAELLKRADGVPPTRAIREDIFYNLPPGSMAKTRRRTAKSTKS